MANVSPTQIQDAQRAAISSIVLDTLREQEKMLATIQNRSSEVSPGDKSLSILSASELESSVEDVPSGSALTSSNLSLSAEVLNLDKHKAIFTRIEDRAIMQSVADIRAEVVKAQAAELALQIDADIIAALKLCSSSAPDHIIPMNGSVSAGTDSLTLEDVLSARSLLRKQNKMFNTDDYYMVISPDREKELLALDDFKNADKFGGPSSIVANSIGKIYGFNVIVYNGNGLQANEVLCYHKDHVAMAMQMDVKAEQNRAPLEFQAEDFTLSVLYGVKTLRGGKTGVYLAGFKS